MARPPYRKGRVPRKHVRVLKVLQTLFYARKEMTVNEISARSEVNVRVVKPLLRDLTECGWVSVRWQERSTSLPTPRFVFKATDKGIVKIVDLLSGGK